jgi:type IV pilus assembly protein PilP
MKRALPIALAAAALVAGCGGDEHGDLNQVDPFRPDRIEVAQTGHPSSDASSKIAAEEKRIKEPLEAFPLESIQMLGTITQDTQTFALVKAGPNLYRVKKGNYMGQNFGVITAIDEGQIKLKELVQDGSGEWVERMSALQLMEAGK